MRRLTGSTSRIWTSTSWEVETILPGWTFFLVQLISETWIRPSIPGSSSTKGAVVGDVGHAALELGVDRVAGGDALPRIGEQLLDAERDAVRLVVDLDDLDLDGLTDVDHLGRG